MSANLKSQSCSPSLPECLVSIVGTESDVKTKLKYFYCPLCHSFTPPRSHVSAICLSCPCESCCFIGNIIWSLISSHFLEMHSFCESEGIMGTCDHLRGVGDTLTLRKYKFLTSSKSDWKETLTDLRSCSRHRAIQPQLWINTFIFAFTVFPRNPTLKVRPSSLVFKIPVI